MATKTLRAMHTENGIEIRGDVKRIFQVAAQVDKWPEILPHYRWVRVLQRKRRRTTVEMAARRGRIPVSWTAVQEVFPYERITYKHIKGFTTGMDVTWSFKPIQERVAGGHYPRFFPVLAAPGRLRQQIYRGSPICQADCFKNTAAYQADCGVWADRWPQC